MLKEINQQGRKITRNIVIIFSLLLVVSACTNSSSSTSPEEKQMITVEIFQNNILQKEFIVTEENSNEVFPVNFEGEQIGEIEFIFYDFHPSVHDYRFFCIDRKYGFYSCIKDIAAYDTLEIDYDLDFEEINTSMNCGTMYDICFGYIANGDFSVWQDSIFIDSLFTDSLGRFQTDISPGIYTLKDLNYETEFELIENYSDYRLIGYGGLVFKPNIYIYPKNEINLDVNISFPKSGKVIKSIPKFPEQWQNLQVKPGSKINNKYNYLFYESIQPKFLQKEKGWIVRKDNLKTFFENNLKKSGFSKSEINDFIEFWIPKLKGAKFYCIYPQYNKELDPLIKLNFSKEPDNIFRLIYVIEEEGPEKIHLQPPQIPACKREGFFVMEWGVILN